MKRILISIVGALSVLCVPLIAQSPQIFFGESFRQGATQIIEENFEVKLSPQNSQYREVIKDSRGNDRYEFTIVPKGPEGDIKITSWSVRLRDQHHAIYDNILRASQEPSADPANNLWWLNPDSYAPVSIHAQRVIHVDSFYVSMLVTAYHFTPLDSPYLDSLVIEVKFSNTDPRSKK